MSKKPSFSGNIELLKAITDATQNQYSIKAGKNVRFDYDANTQTNTINVVDTPNFDELIVNNVNILNELNNKYSIKNNVEINDNEINLNLGVINGLQVPNQAHQAVNKKYVDESLDYFWEQIQAMNFVNFKGRYNDKLTYGMGDLVAFFENNNWYFYLSIIDLNNEPLSSTKGWIKISSPIPNNLVTEDRLNLEVQKLEQKIENGDNSLIKRIENLENSVSKDYQIKVYYLKLKNYVNWVSTTDFYGFWYDVYIELPNNFENSKIVSVEFLSSNYDITTSYAIYEHLSRIRISSIFHVRTRTDIYNDLIDNVQVNIRYLEKK